MTRGGLVPIAVLRYGLAALVVADLVSLFIFIPDARAGALADGVALNQFGDLLSGTAIRALLVLIGTAAAVGFASRPGRLWEGVVSLVALILLNTAQAQLFGSPWRHLFYSGLCLSGWLLGLAVGRSRGAPTDESYARVGSIALLAAAYLNAGLSKVVYGGLDWTSGAEIQAVVIGQDGLVADGLLSLYRAWVVTTPAAASLFSLATVAFELAAPLMLVGRRTRLCVSLGLFAMHANIYVLTGILYWESMVVLLMFGLSADEPSTAAVPDSAAARTSTRGAFAAGVAFLSSCAVVAIGHQAWRYAHRGGGAVGGVPSAAAEPTPRLADRIGPFVVGQSLLDGWRVELLRVDQQGLVAWLSGTPGRAAFEISCAPSEHRSPFDLGALHIFYSSELPLPDLQAVGSAVQEQIRRAAEGGDVCGMLAAWLQPTPAQ
jgi:hypothetical protein